MRSRETIDRITRNYGQNDGLMSELTFSVAAVSVSSPSVGRSGTLKARRKRRSKERKQSTERERLCEETRKSSSHDALRMRTKRPNPGYVSQWAAT
jgi:hypothetical protein